MRIRYSNSLKVVSTMLVAAAFSLWSSVAFGLGDVALLTIAPETEDVSAELPPISPRLSLFGWSAVKGTSYTATFAVEKEPALVVAIGATVQRSVFNGTLGTLAVTVTYAGDEVIADSSIVLPANSFFIAIDPGISTSSTAQTRATATSDRPCYGPATDPSSSTDTSGDFGEDTGLLEPPKPSTADLTVGLPASAPGSYLSTNSFLWCIIPPDPGVFNPGVKVIGPAGKTDKVALFLSNSLIAAQSPGNDSASIVNKSALFSEGLQASIDFTIDDSGLFTQARLLLEKGNVSLGAEGNLAMVGDTGDPTKRPTTAPSTGQVTRSFEVGTREQVSLAPNDITPSGSAVGLFGFIADPELFGSIIELVRVQDVSCGNAQARAGGLTGLVIGRDTISSSGSFNVNVPSSAVFPNNNKKSSVFTRVVNNQSAQSRQITLSNQIRNSRR